MTATLGFRGEEHSSLTGPGLGGREGELASGDRACPPACPLVACVAQMVIFFPGLPTSNYCGLHVSQPFDHCVSSESSVISSSVSPDFCFAKHFSFPPLNYHPSPNLISSPSPQLISVKISSQYQNLVSFT